MRVTFLAAALFLAGPLGAQTLAARIAASRADRITFTFLGKEGVCGNGENFNLGGVRQSRGPGDWDCEEGPVRVTLQMNGRQVMRIRTTVGGVPPTGADDLGEVAPAEAADWLLDLAERGEGRPSQEAVMPAAVARDVVVWPRLAAMAKRRSLREETRKQAIFWLGQQAAEVAVGPLEEVLRDDPEREMQQMALFALTQQRSDRAIEILLRTARTHRDKEVRRTAFFWLGQSEDPRGIRLFEEVLAGR
ncbi:MAG TPA: HEAT repeat domain-containing protein [Gemmatimonadales bacterium]|nr:HEAT repeat domain-containing protein [Gemmatimonadales bacterium]